MNNVINIFEKTKEVVAVEERDFNDIMENNLKNKERIEKQRLRANQELLKKERKI